jgi:hypothetical protein
VSITNATTRGPATGVGAAEVVPILATHLPPANPCRLRARVVGATPPGVLDWLHDVREHLQREVFHQVADLLNLEVDLLFFHTTSPTSSWKTPTNP